MQKTYIKEIRTQSPTYKLVSIKPPLSAVKKKAGTPGKAVTIHLWGYGSITLPTSNNYELLVSNETIPGSALQQMESKEEILISPEKGKGFPLNQLFHNDIMLITDNYGLGAALSFIAYAAKYKKQFNHITILYIIPDQAEILMKEKIKEIQKEFPLFINSNTHRHIEIQQIEYNPLSSKALICASKNIKNTILDSYIKPLGISYKDTLMWNDGDTKAIL